MMKDTARKTALQILNALDKEQQTLDAVLEEKLARMPLDKRDIALIYAIVYGVLRWRARLDYYIACFSKSGISHIRPDILNILRMGIFQMLFADRIPESAAVNTSVNLAKENAKKSRIAGFVNGLLRNVQRSHQHIRFPDPRKDPLRALAVQESFPQWMIERWLKRFGFQETQELCQAHNRIAPLHLRCNTLKITRDELLSILSSAGGQAEAGIYTPESIAVSGLPSPVELPAFEQGYFQVQDGAAQLTGRMFGPRPGEKVLDACAGLGGKTGHMAQMMRNQGHILAVDHKREKLARLQSETARLGISIAETAVYDLNHRAEPAQHGTFDRILLDAPCSGLGVIRRNPDSKWALSKKNLQRYQNRQVCFLENLTPLLKPSGLLLYAVCSNEAEENEDVVSAFLSRHPEFCIEKDHPELPETARSLLTKEGYMRTFPHLHGTDGFFAAGFRKSGVR